MNRFVVIAAVMLAALPARGAPSDSVTLRGRVFGAALTPEPYANVLVLGTRRGVQTDECGKFAIGLETRKPHTLAMQAVGYDQRVIDVPADFDTAVPILVRLDATRLFEGSFLWLSPGRAWFASDYFQGDHAPPPGTFVFCGNAVFEMAGEVATCTQANGRIELRDRREKSSLHVAWRVPESDRTSLVVQSLPERKVVHVLARRVWRAGEVNWDGYLDNGSGLPEGRYRVAFDVLPDSLSLDFERVIRRVPLVVSPSYDYPPCN